MARKGILFQVSCSGRMAGTKASGEVEMHTSFVFSQVTSSLGFPGAQTLIIST